MPACFSCFGELRLLLCTAATRAASDPYSFLAILRPTRSGLSLLAAVGVLSLGVRSCLSRSPFYPFLLLIASLLRLWFRRALDSRPWGVWGFFPGSLPRRPRSLVCVARPRPPAPVLLLSSLSTSSVFLGGWSLALWCEGVFGVCVVFARLVSVALLNVSSPFCVALPFFAFFLAREFFALPLFTTILNRLRYN